MPMGAKEPIERIKPADELYTCPACGYTDGFHVSFKKAAGSKRWQIVLICPQCHKRYQITWEVPLGK